jgi:hypothetical protein
MIETRAETAECIGCGFTGLVATVRLGVEERTALVTVGFCFDCRSALIRRLSMVRLPRGRRRDGP